MRRPNTTTDRFASLEAELYDLVCKQEISYLNNQPNTSLWDHMLRVAILSEKIARAEGLDPEAGRLAGLFHDAGKFVLGKYHPGRKPEELRSAEIFSKLGSQHGLDPALVATVSQAISILYTDDPAPPLLTQVLFDADNLDKLGPQGIANFFIKTGLRGNGLSQKALLNLTVELVYARYAPTSLATSSGKTLAQKLSPQTIRFVHELIEALNLCGQPPHTIEKVNYDSLVLDVVQPQSCRCSGRLERRIWEKPGLKSQMVYLEHRCTACGWSQQIKFCRSRLLGNPEAFSK